MAKEKAVNYTEAQVEVLKSEYTGTDNATEVAAIAAKIGKTPASVRAKLASLKLYKAADKAETSKEDRVTKRVIVEAIAEKVGLVDFEIDGLEKATKSALEKVLANLA